MPFAFEGEQQRTLDSIPLDVRYKLEVAGVTVSLDAWKALPQQDRQRLVAAEDDFARVVAELVSDAGQSSREQAWRREEALLEIEERARALTIAINRTALDDRARYVLSQLVAGDEATFRAAIAELGAAY